MPRIALDPVPDGVALVPIAPSMGRTLALAVREDDDVPMLQALHGALAAAINRPVARPARRTDGRSVNADGVGGVSPT